MKRGWSDLQEEILRDICDIDFLVPMTVICFLVRKSETSIRLKLKELGLKRAISVWSKSDDKYIVENYPNKNIMLGTMSIKLGMSENAIHIRASRLGIKRGISDLDQYLIDNYGKEDCIPKEIASKFCVSLSHVYNRAAELKLVTPHEYGETTTSKYNEITQRYSKDNTVALAISLGVSEYTVRRIASKEKIRKAKKIKKQNKKPKVKPRWTKEQELFLKENYYKMTSNDMMSIFHKSSSSINSKLRHMGLRDGSLKIYCIGSIKFTYITEEEKRRKYEYVTMYLQLLNQNKRGDYYVIRKAS